MLLVNLKLQQKCTTAVEWMQMAALTFDLWDEFAGSGERLHRVEERVHADDLPQDAQNFPQTLMGQWTPVLLFVCRKPQTTLSSDSYQLKINI